MITRQKLIDQIEKYKPYNEQEEKDKILILDWIRNNENAFSRENAVAHMTASAWVVNRERTKVLMVYHNIYNSWSWLGGHADGVECQTKDKRPDYTVSYPSSFTITLLSAGKPIKIINFASINQ